MADLFERVAVPPGVLAPGDFLSKYLLAVAASSRLYPSCSQFLAICFMNALLRNNLSGTVILRKYLKSPYTMSCQKQALSSSF